MLCELAYRWFCPPGGQVLDPFAGGSVRGIVAAMLGFHYVGIDLSERQIVANRQQAEEICGEIKPVWHVQDSRNIPSMALGECDFIFSCPPYFDLEVYSEDAADLSVCDWPAFCTAYRQIIAASVASLRKDRFACFVVGDVRDRAGFYRRLPIETIRAFEDAGAKLYNDAILVTAVGSLPIRTRRMFEGGRKLGKTHQNVLVFYKGDIKQVKKWPLPEFALPLPDGDPAQSPPSNGNGDPE